ncbi:MAG TPA: hypothetical protein PLV31_02010 [Gammaproteobacteria bacterium]|nr:hypothetical protein [Gammaproteobacteria bacterium]HRA42447.1 hypothetical protein [Gammaproteobacteria bacterium]
MTTTQMIKDSLALGEKIIEEITDVVQEGKTRLDITTFGYRRFLLNGQSFGFSDNPDWNITFLEQFSGLRIPNYELALETFLSTNKSKFLRVGVPDKDDHYANVLYEKDIWNSLCLYQYNKNKKYIDCFFLCSKKDNVRILEAYVNEQSFIENWLAAVNQRLGGCLDEDKHRSQFSNTVKSESLKTLLNTK